MNKELLQTILKRLLEIKEGVNVNKNEGICFNLYLYTDHNRNIKPTGIINNEWLKEQFQSWPECHVHEDGTKSLGFPVGGAVEYWEEKDKGTLWKNPRRLKLLDYLIEQASKQLKEMNKEQHHE